MIPAISGAIGPLGPSEWTVGSVGGVDPTAAANQLTATDGTTSTKFGDVLTNAIDSLDQSQATATNAAQALATGQATDPTQAVTAVENASLDMQFASQIRTKLDETVNTIFQTQA